MRSIKFFRSALIVGAIFTLGHLAHAQVRACSNQQINQAYTAVHMTPSGSGNSGDCNPNNYGAGSWTNMSDLQTRIQHAHDCSDPWLGQIYFNLYNRRPTSTECNKSNYGGGSWSSYMDLASKVQAYHTGASRPASPALPPEPVAVTRARQQQLTQYHVDMTGNLIGPANVLMAKAGTYLINATIVAQGGGNIVGQGGGNIVGQGGGNIVPQPGMLVNTNGSNFVVPRR